jgi:hypothetical protein
MLYVIAVIVSPGVGVGAGIGVGVTTGVRAGAGVTRIVLVHDVPVMNKSNTSTTTRAFSKSLFILSSFISYSGQAPVVALDNRFLAIVNPGLSRGQR